MKLFDMITRIYALVGHKIINDLSEQTLEILQGFLMDARPSE